MAKYVENILSNGNMYAKNVYLLGTAILGPVNVPIKITSLSHLYSIFGTVGTIIEAYTCIYECNFDCNIYCVKVTGTHSEAYANINNQFGEIEKDGLRIYSKFANKDFDNIKIELTPRSIIIDDCGKQTEYMYEEYQNFHTLCDVVNENTRNNNGNVFFEPYCDVDVKSCGALNGVNPQVITLKGGNSGIFYNKNMMYVALEDTYSILQGLETDIVVPLNVFFDDTFTDNEDDLNDFYNLDNEYLTLKDYKDEYLSFYNQLLVFCINQMNSSILTHGIINTNKIEREYSQEIDEENTIERLNYFRKLNSNSTIDKYSHLISVVVGDLYYCFGTKRISGSVVYSSLCSSISITSNTTNLPIPNNMYLVNNFSKEFYKKIMECGYTTFRYSELKNSVVVTNGITMSDDEDLRFFVNVRMCQLVMSYIRRLFSGYIGQCYEYVCKSGDLQRDLKLLLDSLVSRNILVSYNVREYRNASLGEITFSFSFKCMYMLEEYTTFASLNSNSTKR